MEDDDYSYSWIGEPRVQDTKYAYYDAMRISVDSLKLEYTIKVGHKVLVRSSENNPYIAEVIELYSCKSSQQMKFKAKWFYRKKEAIEVLKKSPQSFLEDEIVYSNHIDANEIINILQPCYVVFLKTVHPAPNWTEQRKDIFFCRNILELKSKQPPQLQPLSDSKIAHEIQTVYESFPSTFFEILERDVVFWNVYSPFIHSTQSQSNSVREVTTPRKKMLSAQSGSSVEKLSSSGESSRKVLVDSRSSDVEEHVMRLSSYSLTSPARSSEVSKRRKLSPSLVVDLTDQSAKQDVGSVRNNTQPSPITTSLFAQVSVLKLSDEVLVNQLPFENDRLTKAETQLATWFWYMDNHRSEFPVLSIVNAANLSNTSIRFPKVDEKILRQTTNLLALDQYEPYIIRIRLLKQYYLDNIKKKQVVDVKTTPSKDTDSQVNVDTDRKRKIGIDEEVVDLVNIDTVPSKKFKSMSMANEEETRMEPEFGTTPTLPPNTFSVVQDTITTLQEARTVVSSTKTKESHGDDETEEDFNYFPSTVEEIDVGEGNSKTSAVQKPISSRTRRRNVSGPTILLPPPIEEYVVAGSKKSSVPLTEEEKELRRAKKREKEIEENAAIIPPLLRDAMQIKKQKQERNDVNVSIDEENVKTAAKMEVSTDGDNLLQEDHDLIANTHLEQVELAEKECIKFNYPLAVDVDTENKCGREEANEVCYSLFLLQANILVNKIKYEFLCNNDDGNYSANQSNQVQQKSKQCHIEGQIVVFRGDLEEVLLLLLVECKYNIEDVNKKLSSVILPRLSYWTLNEQRIIHTIFSLYGAKMSKLKAALPKKDYRDILEYTNRYLKSATAFERAYRTEDELLEDDVDDHSDAFPLEDSIYGGSALLTLTQQKSTTSSSSSFSSSSSSNPEHKKNANTTISTTVMRSTTAFNSSVDGDPENVPASYWDTENNDDEEDGRGSHSSSSSPHDEEPENGITTNNRSSINNQQENRVIDDEMEGAYFSSHDDNTGSNYNNSDLPQQTTEKDAFLLSKANDSSYRPATKHDEEKYYDPAVDFVLEREQLLSLFAKFHNLLDQFSLSQMYNCIYGWNTATIFSPAEFIVRVLHILTDSSAAKIIYDEMKLAAGTEDGDSKSPDSKEDVPASTSFTKAAPTDITEIATVSSNLTSPSYKPVATTTTTILIATNSSHHTMETSNSSGSATKDNNTEGPAATVSIASPDTIPSTGLLHNNSPGGQRNNNTRITAFQQYHQLQMQPKIVPPPPLSLSEPPIGASATTTTTVPSSSTPSSATEPTSATTAAASTNMSNVENTILTTISDFLSTSTSHGSSYKPLDRAVASTMLNKIQYRIHAKECEIFENFRDMMPKYIRNLISIPCLQETSLPVATSTVNE